VPRGTLYGSLTDPEQIRRWWGPKGFTVPEVDFAPQVGRGYRIAMQPPEGALFHLEGEFRNVELPAELAYTFRWEPPDPDDRETLVTLTLTDLGDETELRLTQGEFATEARYALHEAGWTETLERLDQHLRSEVG
jgi:uncharacterized protein YndB with AHSA1/START domain